MIKQDPIAEPDEIQAATAQSTRVAGLLQGHAHFDLDAFAPMSDEEIAEFDAAPLFPAV